MNESLPQVWFVLVATYLLRPVKGEHWWKTIISEREVGVFLRISLIFLKENNYLKDLKI